MERHLLQVTGTETRLGNVKNVRKNGDGSFELSDTYRKNKFEPIPRKKERRKNEKPVKGDPSKWTRKRSKLMEKVCSIAAVES